MKITAPYPLQYVKNKFITYTLYIRNVYFVNYANQNSIFIFVGVITFTKRDNLRKR